MEKAKSHRGGAEESGEDQKLATDKHGSDGGPQDREIGTSANKGLLMVDAQKRRSDGGREKQDFAKTDEARQG